MTQTRACSEATNEPLPGTAKPGSLFIAMEHLYGWSHDILDGGVFGSELTQQLVEYTENYGAKFQLIRQPGRFGQNPCGGLTVFISRATPGKESLLRLKIDRPEDLLAIDPTAEEIPGAEEVTHPIFLVCTHGKRDVCCAIKGRPIASTLWLNFMDYDGDIIWESSHLKGHRFAPSMVALPWNLNFGRTHAVGAIHTVNELLAGRVATESYRGRGIYKPWVQSAEVAIRKLLDGVAGPDEVQLLENDVAEDGKTARVTMGYFRADGERSADRKWLVKLALEPIGEVISSCGDAPKEGFSWIVKEKTEL